MTEPVNVTLDIASYGMPVPEFIDWIRGGLGGEFTKVADDIEAQVEPTDPVEALVQEYARRDWDVASADEETATWKYFITPSRLREFAAEVLRIGVGEATYPHPDGVKKSEASDGAALPVRRDGEPLAAAPSPTYRQGFDDCALHLRKQLIQLRSSAITAERQDAFDKVIEAVEAMS